MGLEMRRCLSRGFIQPSAHTTQTPTRAGRTVTKVEPAMLPHGAHIPYFSSSHGSRLLHSASASLHSSFPQGQFGKYLEDRGITAELGEYLRFLIYDKEQREYQNWLSEVEAFVGGK